MKLSPLLRMMEKLLSEITSQGITALDLHNTVIHRKVHLGINTTAMLKILCNMQELGFYQ